MGKYETAKTFGGSDKPRALRRRGSWDSPTVRYEWHILIEEVLSKQTTLHTSRQTVSVRRAYVWYFHLPRPGGICTQEGVDRAVLLPGGFV